jgi:hypothetical protein
MPAAVAATTMRSPVPCRSRAEAGTQTWPLHAPVALLDKRCTTVNHRCGRGSCSSRYRDNDGMAGRGGRLASGRVAQAFWGGRWAKSPRDRGTCVDGREDSQYVGGRFVSVCTSSLGRAAGGLVAGLLCCAAGRRSPWECAAPVWRHLPWMILARAAALGGAPIRVVGFRRPREPLPETTRRRRRESCSLGPCRPERPAARPRRGACIRLSPCSCRSCRWRR